MGDRRQKFFHTALVMACCLECETADDATELAMETLEDLGLLHNSNAQAQTIFEPTNKN